MSRTIPVDWDLVEKRMDEDWLFKDIAKEQGMNWYDGFVAKFRKKYGDYPSVYRARKRGILHEVYIK